MANAKQTLIPAIIGASIGSIEPDFGTTDIAHRLLENSQDKTLKVRQIIAWNGDAPSDHASIANDDDVCGIGSTWYSVNKDGSKTTGLMYIKTGTSTWTSVGPSS